MLNIIIAGPPGSGKGTLAKLMIDKFGFVHLSTGDMLRNEIGLGSPLGKEVESILARGDLVSDQIVISLIANNVKANPGACGFLFDGFPRTLPQAEALDDFLEKTGHPLTLMIQLEVDDAVCEMRLLRRGGIENRPDDMDVERVRHRLATYYAQTVPIIDHYKKQGKFIAVDRSKTPEYTLNQVSECLKRIL
ncbi:MAG: adenylate kinase [Bacteroidales bacterium]|nr:adenylate kinase [Bacteroidales bacterium]